MEDELRSDLRAKKMIEWIVWTRVANDLEFSPIPKG